MSRIAFGAAYLSLILMAGCVSYQPQPLDPSAELARLNAVAQTVIVEHRGLDALGGSPAPLAAFNAADGLNEAEVVAVALTANPDLRAKRLEIGQAQALLITAGLWPNPEFSFAGTFGVTTPGLKIDSDLLFELLRPGERAARQSVAMDRIEEVRAEIMAQEIKLAGDVRAQRLALLGAQQELELAKQGVAIRERALELVRERRRLGEGTELDISAADLELAQSKRDLRKAQTRLEAQRLELNRLMGLPPDYVVRLEEAGQPLKIAMFDDMSSQELDRRVVAGRPELQVKEAKYRQAECELNLACMAQYPRPHIGPAYAQELDGMPSVGLGLSMEIPIFNRNQGEIAEKTAQRDQVRAQYVATLHQLRSDAASALAAVRLAKLEVETQEQQVLPLLKRNQDLFEGAFKARELSVLDLIVVQDRVLRARQDYLESVVTYGKAMIELEAAIGAPLSQCATQSTTMPASRP